MESKKVTVLGGGVLGSQIALMCAYAGHNTTVWIRGEEYLEETQPKLERYSSMMLEDLKNAKALLDDPMGASKYPRGLFPVWDGITAEEIDRLYAQAQERFRTNLHIEYDLPTALEHAYIAIEAISEDPDAKTGLYEKISSILSEETLLVTNSSTLLPSRFAQHTGRPEKFCALHFANTIWRCNTAEIMGHAGTDPEVFQQIIAFAKGIHMITLPLYQEQPGYLLNSLLVPWLAAGEALWVNGVADPQTIDLTWKAGLGCPFGPFEHIDVIGLDTVYNINLMKPDAKVEGSVINRLNKMLKEKIDHGETGVNAGKGFYTY